MACNSVAVQSATVQQIAMDKQTLTGLMAALTGQAVDQLGAYEYGSEIGVYSSFRNLSVDLLQEKSRTGNITVTLRVSGGSDVAAAEKVKAELQPALDRLLVQGQQATILKRLQQLGKLDNIKQRDGGITARITVEI